MFRIYSDSLEIDRNSANYLRGCLYDYEGDGTEIILAQRIEALDGRRIDDWGTYLFRLDPGEHDALNHALDQRARREGRAPNTERPREQA